MKPLSYLLKLRATRRRCKSQAFVEFAFILPIFLVMMMGVFDYSFMIMRLQVMAMAAREAANTATRQTVGAGVSVGLNAAYTAEPKPFGVASLAGPEGAAVITHVWYSSTAIPNSNYVLLLDSNYVGSSATPDGVHLTYMSDPHNPGQLQPWVPWAVFLAPMVGLVPSIIKAIS